MTITGGSNDGVWRHDGTNWERVFSGSLGGVYANATTNFIVVKSATGDAVFVADVGGNTIWRSLDDGQTWAVQVSPVPAGTILTLAALDANTLVVGSTTASTAYSTTNNGVIWFTRALGTVGTVNSFAYDSGTGDILVGGTTGVARSQDNAVTWKKIGAPSAGPTMVAFPYGYSGNIILATGTAGVWSYDYSWTTKSWQRIDADNILNGGNPTNDTVEIGSGIVTGPGGANGVIYAANNTVYAASDAPDKGIYRFIIGTSTGWQRINSTLPAGGMIGQLAVSANGVLYGVNFQQVDIINQEGGLERCLSPGATFETVTRGLGDGVTLWGLWLHGDQLWSIDTTGVRLMTYADSLTQPPTLASPLNQAPGTGVIINNTIMGISLDWGPLSGATSYQWQIDDDNDFTSVPAGFEGTTTSSSVRLPVLQPATTYYWRVRASGPVLSPWSARWSFTTSLGGSVVTLSLVSPPAGARDVPVRPLFQWSAIAGAEGYELVVSGDYNFASPSILRIGEYALPGTAWQSDIALNYNTTYYWKARAVSSSSSSAWSAIYIFITEPEPAPEPAPSSPPSPEVESPQLSSPSPPSSPPAPPPPQQSSATPEWAVYLMGLMGLVIVLLLIIIVVMVVRRY